MIRRRVLARQLKLLREQSGLTLEHAAPKLDFSVSKLSRIENAQVVIDVHWVKSMLDVYDVGGARWHELLERVPCGRPRARVRPRHFTHPVGTSHRAGPVRSLYWLCEVRLSPRGRGWAGAPR